MQQNIQQNWQFFKLFTVSLQNFNLYVFGCISLDNYMEVRQYIKTQLLTYLLM